MSRIKQFQHVNVTVADLDAAAEFFRDLGLVEEGRASIEGEFIDTVLGIPEARSRIVMLRPPGGGTGVELGTFLHPDHVPGSPAALSTELGLRAICFEVEDLRGIVAELEEKGYGLVGGIGEHEATWLMAYVRGPEGIIVSLTEQIGA